MIFLTPITVMSLIPFKSQVCLKMVHCYLDGWGNGHKCERFVAEEMHVLGERWKRVRRSCSHSLKHNAERGTMMSGDGESNSVLWLQCWLQNVCIGCEKDNYDGWKLAMMFMLCRAPPFCQLQNRSICFRLYINSECSQRVKDKCSWSVR